MTPKVLIQIVLSDAGEVAVSSTSGNQITNLGLISIAEQYFKSTLQKKEESSIVHPRFEV